MIMSCLAAIKESETTEIRSSHSTNFNYFDIPSVHKLLDTIASIIADEYIEKAKQNPEIFLEIGGKK